MRLKFVNFIDKVQILQSQMFKTHNDAKTINSLFLLQTKIQLGYKLQTLCNISIKMSKSFLIFTLLLSICVMSLNMSITDDLCNNCVDPQTLRYVCSQRNCSRFTFTNLDLSYCPDADRFYGLQCRSAGGSSRYCYYTDKFDNFTKTCYYTACNYSLPNCGSCSYNYSCSSCYGGYFKQDYDLDTDYQNCASCSKNIYGCLKCSSATRCTICEDQYILMGDGYCHNKDGTLPNGIDVSTNHIFITLVILAVFMLLGLILGAVALKLAFFSKPKYHQPLLQN